MTATQRNILNIMVFQIFWFACVLGGNAGAAIALALYAFVYTRFIGNPLKQWKALGTIALCGLLVDIAMAEFGVIHFADSAREALWLLLLWLGFGTLFFHGLAWLRKLPLAVIALIGAVAGPLTYWAGANLNDSRITVSPSVFMVCYGIPWAILLPLFTHIPRLLYASEKV